MSGQPAENVDERVSTDSRLDSILDQLNALGGSGSVPSRPAPALRSVPNLPPEADDDRGDESHDEPVVAEMPPTPPPVLGLVPPPLETPPSLEVPPIPAPVDVPPALDLPPLSAPVAPTPPPIPAPLDTAPVAAAETMPPAVEQEQPPETNFTFGASESIEATEPIETVEPIPVVVEYHAPPAAPESLGSRADDDLVFELDGPLAEEAAAASESDPGWVSHHEEPVAAALDEPVDVVEPPVFDTPQWGEINEDPDLRGDDPTAAGAASALPAHVHGTVEAEHVDQFATDEELPLPDFTGVWDDSADLGVWDDDPALMGGVPDPVEGTRSGSGISVGRNELDSLRPAEEEKAAKPPAQNLGPKLQLFAVILFGLIALAVVLLNDPAVVAELREIYDGFFG